MKLYPLISSMVLLTTFKRNFSVKCCEKNCHWKNKIEILEKQLTLVQNQKNSYFSWGWGSILIFFPNSFYCAYKYDELSYTENKIKNALLTLKTTNEDVDIKPLI